MNPSTISALATLSSLPSASKTSLMRRIAYEMTSTIITISREIQRGTLDPDKTAPMSKFVRTFQQANAAQQRKLERRLKRCQRRARKWRAERRWIRREFAEMMRLMETLQGRWKARVEGLKRKSRFSVELLQMRMAGRGSGQGQKQEQGSRSRPELELSGGGESISGL
ncbi:hypothetical protein BJX68DRAFT_270458 [Aspergillus pseudodeflectus]|uniref:BZIP domain-containing protein n=1 Tax=Aspergillus pseudodeflectus TaxID=176178 RepID=A0ABR4JS04_9EURO